MKSVKRLMNENNIIIIYKNCTLIVNMIEILQRLNIIYKIHDKYYIDIK